jgi:hypothetical protein
VCLDLKVAPHQTLVVNSILSINEELKPLILHNLLFFKAFRPEILFNILKRKCQMISPFSKGFINNTTYKKYRSDVNIFLLEIYGESHLKVVNKMNPSKSLLECKRDFNLLYEEELHIGDLNKVKENEKGREKEIVNEEGSESGDYKMEGHYVHFQLDHDSLKEEHEITNMIKPLVKKEGEFVGAENLFTDPNLQSGIQDKLKVNIKALKVELLGDFDKLRSELRSFKEELMEVDKGLTKKYEKNKRGKKMKSKDLKHNLSILSSFESRKEDTTRKISEVECLINKGDYFIIKPLGLSEIMGNNIQNSVNLMIKRERGTEEKERKDLKYNRSDLVKDASELSVKFKGLNNKFFPQKVKSMSGAAKDEGGKKVKSQTLKFLRNKLKEASKKIKNKESIKSYSLFRKLMVRSNKLNSSLDKKTGERSFNFRNNDTFSFKACGFRRCEIIKKKDNKIRGLKDNKIDKVLFSVNIKSLIEKARQNEKTQLWDKIRDLKESIDYFKTALERVNRWGNGVY